MPTVRPAIDDASLLEQVLCELRRVIVGQEHLVERLVVALLAGGHLLLEGPPGVAETPAAETLATIVGGSFARSSPPTCCRPTSPAPASTRAP
jgi:MoxR-like ATPase